jgi:putative transposase
LLSNEVEDVIATAVDECYLQRRCPSVADFVREIGRLCAEAQLFPPSRKAVSRRIEALDPREVIRRRKGASYARRKFGQIVGHLRESQALGLVRIDHTLFPFGGGRLPMLGSLREA